MVRIMFWKWLKGKGVVGINIKEKDNVNLSNYSSYIDCDIDVETARRNYEAYQNDLTQRQADLIKKWCREIDEASKRGEKFIFTNEFVTDDNKDKILYMINSVGCCYDFPPNATLQYFQRYFEDRGFKVVKIKYSANNICRLKIFWIYHER